MRSAKWWLAIALFLLVLAPWVVRAQGQGAPDRAAAESWLADDPDDAMMDDDMGLAPPAPGGGEFGPGGGGMRGQQRWGMMGRGGPGMRGGAGMRRRLEDLDLTDAQRKKLAEIRDTHARTAINQRASVELASLDLRKLMRADKPDVGAIERQIDKVSSLRAALTKNRVTGMLEARALLTPEQLEKLRSPRGSRERPESNEH